jgi:hypothetical protein
LYLIQGFYNPDIVPHNASLGCITSTSSAYNAC